MINRRFMIVPPALPSGGHAEQLEQTSKDFPCLLLETANMRVLYKFSDVNVLAPLLTAIRGINSRGQIVEGNDDGIRACRITQRL
jgi:hypothetical protein